MIQTVRPTKKQRVLLDFIEKFIAEHGYSPSYREIMNGCNYNSIATVAVHINNLISRGHLRKRDHSARSLELTAVEPDNLVATKVSSVADKVKSDDSTAADQGPAWLINQVEVAFRQTEASLDSMGISAEAQQAYNKTQVLMATLKILQIDQLGEADGRNFAARLQRLKATMEASMKSIMKDEA